MVLALVAIAAFSIALTVRHIEKTLAHSATRTLARTFGDEVVVTGPTAVHLLPRPYVTVSGLHLPGADGRPALDIQSIRATQSIGSMLSGRPIFSEFRLVAPAVSLDADAFADGDARAAIGLLAHALPGRIAIESGSLTLRSRHAALAGVLDNIDAVIDGMDRNGTAALKGLATWRGNRLDIAARIDPFFDFVLGHEATGTVKLRSPLVTASVDGKLHAGIKGGFDGKVAFSAPALPDLLRVAGWPSGLGQMVEKVSFSGTGLANPDTITFSDARLGLDDTQFDGSLAWQPNGGRWSWTGTFATETLDFRNVLNTLPTLRGVGGRFSDLPLRLDPALLGDIDLRISASRALLGPITVEDAAFSALCRDGRIEAGFSEARSLDGLVRGRAVATVAPHGVDLRVDLSMSQMDLDPLAAILGTTGLTGSASGHLIAEAHGGTPRELSDSLAGRGQISVRGGTLPPLPKVADVSALKADAPAWIRSGSTLNFDLLTADLELGGNRLRAANGRVLGADGQQGFVAETSLLDRSFSLVAMPSDDPSTSLAGQWGSRTKVLRASADPDDARDHGKTMR